MMWSEVKKWAKSHGYETSKGKDHYTWHRIDNPERCGIVSSVSKLAKAIYNDITDNYFIDHQESYINEPRF